MEVQETYDLVVIGGGSGGVAAARRAAALGGRVALCEEREVGGTCVHRGCVPKKLLVHASQFARDFELAQGYGWDLPSPRLDFARLQKALRQELRRLEGLYLGMLEKVGVTLYRGHARFVDAETVEVEGRHLRGRSILVATGSRPSIPDVPGADLAVVSDRVLALERLPERVLVVGSGYIGSEFASLLHALGCQVSLVFRSSALLPGFDGDLRQALTASLRERGVGILAASRLVEARPEGASVHLVVSDGTEIEADLVVLATGRQPNTEGLDLATAGVRTTTTGAIEVDADQRTSVPHIYALGDVTPTVQLTPVAIAEARALVERLFRNHPARVDYDRIPRAVFTLPNVATVGLSEEEARARGHEVRIFRTRFRPMRYALTSRKDPVLMKLVVDGPSDRVLGAHMFGPEAAETIQALAVALQAGVTKATMDRTMALHPTLAEEFVLMYEPAG